MADKMVSGLVHMFSECMGKRHATELLAALLADDNDQSSTRYRVLGWRERKAIGQAIDVLRQGVALEGKAKGIRLVRDGLIELAAKECEHFSLDDHIAFRCSMDGRKTIDYCDSCSARKMLPLFKEFGVA